MLPFDLKDASPLVFLLDCIITPDCISMLPASAIDFSIIFIITTLFFPSLVSSLVKTLFRYIMDGIMLGLFLFRFFIFAILVWNHRKFYSFFANVLADHLDPTTASQVIINNNTAETEAQLEEHIRRQRSITTFQFAGSKASKDYHLALRARANVGVRQAFGIENSLTTTSPESHKSFLNLASGHVNERTRDWTRLYDAAKTFLESEITTARATEQPIQLAESIQCACLTVVLADNFAVDPATLPRQSLVVIASEINRQWLMSKESKHGGTVKKSYLLEGIISSLHLVSYKSPHALLLPEYVLSLIMPQYETLWRVVLLAFVTAYHRQFDPALAKRVEGVPGCLGKPEWEKEAVKVGKESLRLYPSNKRIYRCTSLSPKSSPSETIKADVESCHRSELVWGEDALRFKPERFDSLTELQKEAYFPYSLRPHRCPAFSGFGDRMVTMLVVCLGRVLRPEIGRVRFGGVLDHDEEKALPTGRDEVGGWTFELERA
ncbi:hypothetical protein QBC43DRAFT_304254 [Cladorrhinum sp. PSN259]|nr:hypothetical protein QBC43DRAFT_304254 [Cladorrhinum sp. PSN259]